MIVVAGTIDIDPTKRGDLEAAFDRMRSATLAEEGCLSYQAYLDRGSPGTFFIFEKWRGQEDLTAHFQTPHMAAFADALGAAGVAAMEVKKYEVSAEGDVP